MIGLALVVITSLLFSYWTPLRSFFFVGESTEAARLSGIRVTRLAIAAYLLSALFVWFTAVLLTSANKIGYANYGIGAELTGASGAIGSAVAKALTELGAHVVAIDIAEASSASANAKMTSLLLDLSDADAIAAVCSDLIHRFGSIDILVNNAGSCPTTRSTTRRSKNGVG
jgi:D-arabinose 1-dehydrogenase-like Zn-dependent alcohol dehydrogenase